MNRVSLPVGEAGKRLVLHRLSPSHLLRACRPEASQMIVSWIQPKSTYVRQDRPLVLSLLSLPTMGPLMEHVFTQSELEAIAAALADTSEGLTGSEIGHILSYNDDQVEANVRIKVETEGRFWNLFDKQQNRNVRLDNRLGLRHYGRM